MVKAIVAQLKGVPVSVAIAGAPGMYGPNCKAMDFSKYPSINFVMGAQTITASPQEYTLPDSSGNYCNGVYVFQADDFAPLGGGIFGALRYVRGHRISLMRS